MQSDKAFYVLLVNLVATMALARNLSGLLHSAVADLPIESAPKMGDRKLYITVSLVAKCSLKHQKHQMHNKIHQKLVHFINSYVYQ